MYSKKGFDIMELYACQADVGYSTRPWSSSRRCPLVPMRLYGCHSSSSRLHGNVRIGVHATDNLLFLEPAALQPSYSLRGGWLSDNMRRFGYVPNILEEGLDL
ncbi:hypothetical protein GIB67_039117 [Kingdonia uniflora]|uniref:Uncharacterized protein n=1 Tax=Kingdonia uniflora TaxID=39325 RepID=A0A7J7KVC1_9MAGN|nr:hypothetical protein GIB67_039117 [Kingdonia uniflora]